MAEQFSLAETIQLAISSNLDDFFVARPGKVTAYDPITNTAVVQPMVKHTLFAIEDGERSYEELPEIPFVPVLFPRTSGYALTMPVSTGDFVLLVFCDVSLAEWRASGENAAPVDVRRHSIGWPVAIPGFFPDSSPLSAGVSDLAARAAGMTLGQHGGTGRIEISPTAIKLGATAVDSVALATPTAAGLAACMAAANAAIAGVAALIATFNAHVHTGVTTGPGASGPPATPAASGPAAGSAPGAVASVMVKAL